MPGEELKLYSPTLYVGLGGAGGAVVNSIAQKLKSREDWKDIGDIFQFFAIDTDRKDMEKNTFIPQAHRFIISGFDKGRYVEEKLGRAGVSLSRPDPKVAQWVHDWYNFRSSQGAGAGQIRIESRISLYNSFESTDLIKRLEGAIAKTIHMRNSFVDTKIKKMNVMIYFSVAGGTGSGSHLMIAAMLRHLVANMGWTAHIIGINMLPTLFLQYIRNPRQREDILTNGYAALKEVEHLMKLKVHADDRSQRQEIPFVYHPFIASNSVSESPFDFMYIIDTTTEINVGDSYREAVADGVYLQLMSPLFARRDSDYDNYEKNQKRLARELFTVHYGSFGCSVLLVPDHDILEYCALRLALDQMFEYVGGAIRIPSQDGEWEALTEEEKRTQQDALFVRELRKQYEIENPQIRKKYKILGINSKYDYEHVIGLQEEIDEGLKKKNKDLINFFKNLTVENYEVQIFNRYFQSVYEFIEQESKRGKTGKGLTGFEYKGVRLNFQRWLEKNFLEKIAELLRTYDFSPELNPTPDRQADDNKERVARVQEELNLRMDKITTSLLQFQRELKLLAFGASNYFKNLKTLARFFTDEKLDLLSQQFFTIVLISEFLVRRKVIKSVLGTMPNFDNLLAELKGVNAPDNTNFHELLESAKITLKEGLKRRQEDQEFKDDYMTKWRRPVEKGISQIRKRLFLEAAEQVYQALLAGLKDYLVNLRNFSNSSQEIIENFRKNARHFLESAGVQSNEFELDVEVLQDLNGKRMWDDYYEKKIKGNFHLKDAEVVQIINDAFASDRLLNPRDKAEYIKEKLTKLSREILKSTIVGKYTAGHDRSKRGLLIDDGLQLEAELKFIEYLENVNRWEDEKDVYRQYLEQPEEKPESLRKFEQELAHFSKNYLEHKLLKCIRRSGILANVNENDPDVVEFACKQQMIAYDTELYKEPEQDGEGHFVSILKKIAPEAGENHLHWPDDAKKVIFYQAILGIPLFTFRNVVGLMKEAYNKRVLERDWQNPRVGRQYPLHIDKNWESDDPFVDPTNLPLNLDPDDAKIRDESIRSLFNNFFATFLKLTNHEYIIWDDEEGYVIPKGKLGNFKDRVILGASTREAVVTILKNVHAHELINQVTADLPLTKEDIKARIKELKPFLQRDAWTNEKADPEAEIIMNMLTSLLREIESAEKALAERNRRPNLARKKKPSSKKPASKS